jgi:hypothetical protein
MFTFQSISTIWESSKNRWIIIILGFILLTLMGWAATTFIPEQIDWVRTYRPATRELMALRSPYTIKSFFNPPWILLPMVPIALLPDKIGNGILFVVSLCTIIYSAIRMGAKPLSLVAFSFSFPVLFLLLFGQIDWMIFLGFTLPPQFGLFLVLSKPQVAIPYAIFWLFESWRIGGIRQVLRTFLPVSIMFLISFLVFGIWFKNIDPTIVTTIYNFSLWPFGLVLGLAFLAFALVKRKKEVSIVAGPFFSPYVGVHSWAAPLLAILPLQWLSVAASAGSWIMYFLRIPH